MKRYPLDEKELQAALLELPDWQVMDGKYLSKSLQVK